MLSTFFLFDRRLITRFDLSLFFITLLIVGFGIFNLYSASISVHAVGAVYKKQVYWLFLGIVLLFLGSFLNYSYLEQFGIRFYGIGEKGTVYVFLSWTPADAWDTPRILLLGNPVSLSMSSVAAIAPMVG